MVLTRLVGDGGDGVNGRAGAVTHLITKRPVE
jgi:hypothetical protein